MRKAVKITAAGISVLTILILILITLAYYFLPSNYFVTNESNITIRNIYSISCFDESGNPVNSSGETPREKTTQENITLFNVIPVKSAQVTRIQRKYVIPGGDIFGIRLYTSGVMIVGMQDIVTAKGSVNPAEKAGLQIGDIITHVNKEPVNKNTDVMRLFESSDGKGINIDYVRGEKSCSTVLYPQLSKDDNKYRAGLWVRDSTAGIGTMTYYDDENNIFAGLGHGICDVDTGEIMPLLGGDIVEAVVNSCDKGSEGTPGELIGAFSGAVTGNLVLNTAAGIYGNTIGTVKKANSEKIPVATKQEVQSGKAYIISTIDGKTPEKFEVEVKKIFAGDSGYKNMVVKVTDSRLIEKTGGIVQGMSGSPIIQNGMLIGAVTHVFVNDPLQGYGIYAEKMIEISDTLTDKSAD